MRPSPFRCLGVALALVALGAVPASWANLPAADGPAVQVARSATIGRQKVDYTVTTGRLPYATISFGRRLKQAGATLEWMAS